MNGNISKKHVVIISKAESPAQVLINVLDFLRKNEEYDPADKFVCMNGFCMGLSLAQQILENNIDRAETANDFIKAIPEIYYEMLDSINMEDIENGEDINPEDTDLSSVIGLN